MQARQMALQGVALLLLLTAAASSAQQDSQQDLGGGIGAALQVSKLISDLLSSGDGKMIVSAAGDGSQCLDAGIWPSGCYDFTDPFCSSVGVWVWPTCTSSPWTYFRYDGKLSFNNGLRGLGRRLCVQAWACSDSSSSTSNSSNAGSSSSSGSKRRLSGVVIDVSGADADSIGADASPAAVPPAAAPAATPAPAAAAPQQPTTPLSLSGPAASAEPVPVDDGAPAAAAPAAPAANTTQSGDAAAEPFTVPAEQQGSEQLQFAPSCDARGAPCGWGGPQYMMHFSADEARRSKSGFPLFRIHFANKGDGWCLTNTQTDISVGSQARLQPCDGSLSQLWFIPQW